MHSIENDLKFILNLIWFDCHKNQTKTLIDCSQTENKTMWETLKSSYHPSSLSSTVSSVVPSAEPYFSRKTIYYLIIGGMVVIVLVLFIIFIVCYFRETAKTWRAAVFTTFSTTDTKSESSVKTISSKGKRKAKKPNKSLLPITNLVLIQWILCVYIWNSFCIQFSLFVTKFLISIQLY